MPELKRLKNVSGIAQTVMYFNRPVVLQPGEEQLIDGTIAEKFLEHCPGTVEEIFEDIGAEFVPDDAKGKRWIANVTGNPDAPDTVPVRNFINKRWVDGTIDNPIKKARSLAEWAEGPMVEYIAKDGVPEALNMPGKFVTIPEFRRRQLDIGEARWFLNRISNSSVKVDGIDLRAAIPCRAPTDFEPTMEWDLDEMRGFLQICDANSNLGPSEDQVKKECGFDKRSREGKMAIDAAKRLCLKRLYFKVIHPEVKLPGRKEFYDFMDGLRREKEKAKNEAKKQAKASASVEPAAA